jgi:signal transduction histidine kinase
MYCVVAIRNRRRLSAPAVLLMCALFAGAAGAETVGTPTPQLLTNLFQLRQQADQAVRMLHPFRVVAEVISADATRGVLALRDNSGAEFIRVGFTNREVVPGATIILEGWGCAIKREGFGLAVGPGMVVDNDGIHAATVESGRVFLNAGMAPIRLEWFNRLGELVLGVEYEGPNLPRQPIPEAVLFRATVDRAIRPTNYFAGLDYRYYEGEWERLPNFGKLQPAKTGVAANFDLKVRPRDDNVGLEFTGFIKIAEAGVYTFHVNSDDGGRLFLGAAVSDVRVVSNGPALSAEPTTPSRLLESHNRPWVAFEGTVVSAGIWGAVGELCVRVGDDEIQVEIFDGSGDVSSLPRQGRVRVTGMYEEVQTEAGARVPGRLLVLNWEAVQPIESGEPAAGPERGEATNVLVESGPSGTNGGPVLFTAAEIKALSPEQAQQRLPVSIRGVATLAMRPFAVIQDSTKGVYVDLSNVRAGEPIRRGEFCQVEGVTGPGLFSPIIVAQRVVRLGVGQMPKPVRATWAQLMNGGLDSDYVEIDGVVTAVQNNRLILLTQGGKIAVELRDFRPEVLPGYEGALIRIRGCCQANFNLTTRKLEAGAVTVGGALVEVLERAPRDLFDAPRRSIGELLFYDPEASPFRRLKISGQVLYSRAGECFLTDGLNGVHVTTRNPSGFEVGELVEAVGFLKVGGHAAELTEAVMRKTGQETLPPPLKLPPEELLQARHASTLVQTEATLINYWREASEHVLELQAGFIAFRARVGNNGPPITLPPEGSRLEVTGVYAAQGMEVGDGTVNGFELLLASAGGIRVLTTPPWWTLQRVLILSGILAALLLAVLIWNKELQWKVQKRGRQLEAEIQNRQQAEMEHAAEAERARIARDLHDELGTGLTELSLLSSASLGAFRDEEKNRTRFRVIAEKARDLVTNLDVIVWAVDPKHNSLQSFADYLESYTRELLSASGIVCRCRMPIECGSVALSGSARHSLLLAIKETLNNALRHAAATEIELAMTPTPDHLEIVITDNGCGFDWKTIKPGHGLTNVQVRLQKLGGQCRIEPQLGRGTKVTLSVPLPSPAGRPADLTETRDIR